MNSDDIHFYYFLGIGGIGMSALARYYKAMGKEVLGYDNTSTTLTAELAAEGIQVHFDEQPDLIRQHFNSGKWTKENFQAIYTPAIPKNHSEFVLLNDLGLNIQKRAEVLGQLTKHSQTIAVAGTHGKTTTSSLITHIFKTSDSDCSAFLGGITKNYNTNLIISKSLQPGTPFIVEADEYDRSFLTLHPSIAIITSLDADHLDIYGSKEEMERAYAQFARQLQPGGKLIINKTVKDHLDYTGPYISYSITKPADYRAINIRVEKDCYTYDIQTPTCLMEKMILGLPGLHNVENSLAAVAAAFQMNIPIESIRRALQTFEGVKRRFDYQIKNNKIVFIDDYAHHPEELRACISSVRQMYPEKKLTGIFQPHLYSRTRDFAEDFSKSLDLLDECILLDIYPARELPIQGVSSDLLLGKMKITNKILCSKENLIHELSKRKLEVVLTLGAGDIDTLVGPVKNFLMEKYK
jgi:UDP-N-acetylmuramate--alanine ligase